MAWFLIVLGCCFGGAALLAKMFFEHEATKKFDYCQKQLSVLKSQVRQATDERDALDKDLPKGGGPLDIRLQSAEQELAKLEEEQDPPLAKVIPLPLFDPIAEAHKRW